MNEVWGKIVVNLAAQVMTPPALRLTSIPAPPDLAAQQRAHKITKATRDFEAVLLNTLLGPLEKTFSSLPGKEHDAVSDNYQSLGMQALTSCLAANGGLGLADMIAKSLSKRDHGGAHEKSLAKGASLARPS
jgi:Rod binding domain-containing protein